MSYVNSFIEKNALYIQMEYCEIGDLASHIKQKQKKGETFTEEEILNWFI